MSKKNMESAKSAIIYEVDPTECPFREFRDNELSPDYWGLGPPACRAAILLSGKAPKPPPDFVWVDDQTQPLPRSVRQYLNGWVRAEDLAFDRWEAEVVVFEDSDGGKMSVADTQLSHAQVLMRSSFCRKVLSACFMLERVEGLVAEHQWENFVFSLSTEGWRARYHIYSPGLKPGGGTQHRPGLSKNGCYLVRLFYLGAWRCVWVSDQVPVDATDSPLLPFSPLLSKAPTKPGAKSIPTMVTSGVVHLWPLLICKALLKLAAPDMGADEDSDCVEDEEMAEFDLLHALTGCMNLTYYTTDPTDLWKLLITEIPVFGWDDDDDTLASTVKSKSVKKPTARETVVTRRSLGTILIQDTKNLPSYVLPGITPGHEMTLMVTMARDLPLKKPLPEPEVALWKYYRWVDWARSHGLYEAYDCPRTRFLKVNGLMKMSYAPHLLDVQSTESITFGFREEHDRTAPTKKTKNEPAGKTQTGAASTQAIQTKEELREWVQYDPMSVLIKCTNILYFPSMFEFTSAASCPPMRITKAPLNRAIDIVAPKCAPLYLQIDGPDENCLKISLNMLHPRIQINSGIPIVDYIEPAYLILEKFDWFVDCELPSVKAFVRTRGYDSVEVKFLPGRHYCRLWVHSRMNWHVMMLSDSSLLLGSRDIVQTAAVRECPWAARFLNNLSAAFSSWIKVNRSNPTILAVDKDFFRSYQPDLEWVEEIVGYKQALVHWMFRQALQSLLSKKVSSADFRSVCMVLRHYFCDPDFGLPPKPKPPISLREIVNLDPCDCLMPEMEEVEITDEECLEEEETTVEEKPLVDSVTMIKLLTPPVRPVTSQVCELSTEELPCGILKDEREKMVKKHEAATVIQAHWRGAWARKCLNERFLFTSDVLKLVMENSFGNLESLSALMNEFFGMYPGAKTAYSVASALSGVNGVFQHHGVSTVTPRCKWIPYFQGVFFCHSPVKVHLDVQSSIPHCTISAYNNDTGEPMPQAFNSHITYDFFPNEHGYTVMAHGTLSQEAGSNYEVHWQFTVLSSIEGAFHVCDNDLQGCKEIPMQPAQKTHIDEMFLPNRRNILGGILISVTKHEAISFRAAATSPELQMVATLRSITPSGEIEELAKCSGKGEIHWPYIRLKPSPSTDISSTMKKRSTSQANLTLRTESAVISARSLKAPPKSLKPASAKGRPSSTKLKGPAIVEPKQYSIEVTAPAGWPLTLGQWMRVDEVRNTVEVQKIETPKKTGKEKSGSGKEKDKAPQAPVVVMYTPLPDDAYIELECSLTVGGGATARRDDLRDLKFLAARKQWDADEPGRNNKGAQIRKEFRTEFLEALPIPPSESSHVIEEIFGEIEGEEDKKQQTQQGPTPATESGMMEMTVESEEEAKYLLMPEQLKDKFISLYFLPFCMKEKIEEESVLLTPDMAEAAKIDRLARIEAGISRMKELQTYNEIYVLGRQRKRNRLLETLFVESSWCPELDEILQERDDAIAQETLLRTLSANKKKQDMKKK